MHKTARISYMWDSGEAGANMSIATIGRCQMCGGRSFLDGICARCDRRLSQHDCDELDKFVAFLEAAPEMGSSPMGYSILAKSKSRGQTRELPNIN